MNESAILAKNLTKSYGSTQVLFGVDLEVKRGEVFGFLGPNGAGKTTTIRCMLDLIRPSGGDLKILGVDPQREPTRVHRQVGYLPGELSLDDGMTPEAIFKLFTRLRGGKIDWSQVETLAGRLHLELKNPIKNLSRGNKQKVGVIQAFMHNPQLLFLDEPTTGLDPHMQREVQGMVREAAAEGATVFFSSHILTEVQAVTDRVAIIRNGRVADVASKDELKSRSVKKVRVKFAAPIDPNRFTALKGVKLVPKPGDDGKTIDATVDDLLLQVRGDMGDLLQELAAAHAQDLETEQTSLEEIFLAYYDTEGPE